MTINYLNLFLLSFFGSVVGLLGGIVFLYNKKLSHVLEKNSIPFAAGVLITVSLLGLLPESFEIIGSGAFITFIISFIIAYLFEHFFFNLHHHIGHEKHHHSQNELHSSVWLVIVGDTIHNFIDGVAMGAAFIINPGLGLISSISTLLHEIPHEVGDFGILLKAGWRKRNILIVNISSAIFAIIGAFSIILFSQNEVLIGHLLSVSGGIFLYLGAIDFLPRADEGFKNKIEASIPIVIGVIIMLLTLFAIPHSQDEHGVNTNIEYNSQTEE